MNHPRRKIIISIDDGDRNDLEIAAVTYFFKIPTIFYISPEYSDFRKSDLECLLGNGKCRNTKAMGKIFELGSHGMFHFNDYKKVNDNLLLYELEQSKIVLEDWAKRPVTKFCYPGGKFNKAVKSLVKTVGYTEARTTNVLCTDFPKDPFAVVTSVHVHPKRKEYGDEDWVTIGRRLFEKVLRDGGRFELFCHGWEVEQYNMGDFLGDFIKYMRERLDEEKINQSQIYG